MASSSSSNLLLILISLVCTLLSSFVHSSGAASWCVCKEGLSDAVLQKTLDYACGAGADCNPVKANGVCYSPNSVRAHCSYAVNSYFQKKGESQGSCDFAGTAGVVTSDPSYTGCAFPSSASSAATTSTPTTSTTGTATPTTSTASTTTTTNSPYTATPTGVLGAGMGPTGINTDMSHGGLRLTVGFPLIASLLAVAIVVAGVRL
ncbi:hypothetical protein MLD38_039361 [Melastoma candidum]|uniref:Uncharacterized protein n=1 Tax=Melastoma candidum TaxID=119954 RepID=A0ACB9L2W3_9MYRT|nr:hypothetical protein MLD38_039361 [Melastoma candidum]